MYTTTASTEDGNFTGTMKIIEYFPFFCNVDDPYHGQWKQLKVGWDNFKIHFIAAGKVTNSKFCLGNFALLKGSRIFFWGIIWVKVS